jgi:hypothetical protein
VRRFLPTTPSVGRLLDLGVAFPDLRLVNVIEVDRLPEGEHVLGAIVTGERGPLRLLRRRTPHVAMGRQRPVPETT